MPVELFLKKNHVNYTFSQKFFVQAVAHNICCCCLINAIIWKCFWRIFIRIYYAICICIHTRTTQNKNDARDNIDKKKSEKES